MLPLWKLFEDRFCEKEACIVKVKKVLLKKKGRI